MQDFYLKQYKKLLFKYRGLACEGSAATGKQQCLSQINDYRDFVYERSE